MARITGKNAKLRGVLARTSVIVAVVMTDSGDQKTYSYNGYWNPNKPPDITKQTGGVGPFNPVARTAYTVNYYAGTITFAVANGATDVIKVNNIEWMTMQDVGDLYNWSFDAKLDTVDVTGFQDQFKQKLSTFRGWTATVEGYHVSGYWFTAFLGNEFYVELFPDAATTEKWVGAAHVSDGVKLKFDSAVTEHLSFDGTGALTRIP